MINEIANFFDGIDTFFGSPIELIGLGLLIYYLIPDKHWFVSAIMIGLFVLAVIRFLVTISNWGEDDFN